MKMKKNLAIVMSAVTAVGAVAPVVANAAVTTKNVTRDEAIKEAEKALDTVYSKKTEYAGDNKDTVGEDAARSVYKVYLVKGTDVDLKDSDLLDEVEKLNGVTANAQGTVRVQKIKEIRDAADSGKSFKVVIVDKGHAKVDGRTVYKRDVNTKVYVATNGLNSADKTTGTSADGNEVTNLTFADSINSSDANTKKFLKKAIKSIAKYDKRGEYKEDVRVDTTDGTDIVEANDLDDAGKLVITLKSGKTIELKLGEAAYDLSKPRNAAGEKLDVNNQTSDYDQVAETTTTFDKLFIDEDDEDKTQEVMVVGMDANIYEISKMARTLEYKVDEVYSNENGYSDKGADIVNAVIRLAKKKDNEWRVANIGGTNYKRTENATELQAKDLKVDYVNGEYVLKVKVDKAMDTVDSQNNNEITQNLDIIFRGKSLSEVNKIRDDILAGTDVVPGKFDKIVGKNRFQTAIEVSKERFDKNETADSVIIVGANAITDGLAAAPLASAKNAPVLLAGKNKLDKDTMAEIDRVVKDIKNKKVYIVGGKSSVSEEVEAQLKAEFNVVPVRLAGADRYATSLEVAKRMLDDKNINPGDGKVFFTGGTGAADAMSISAVASIKDGDGKVSPIIIMKKDGFDRETRRTIGLVAAEGSQAYVIGGTGTVSYEGMQALNKILAINKGTDAKRVSGKNRYATNAEVIKEFYNAPEVKNKALPRVYAASAFDNYLVDAQTAGALAAVKGPAPILLVGNKLDKEQADLFSKKVNANKVTYFVEGETKLTQVGGAASATALKEIVKALDL